MKKIIILLFSVNVLFVACTKDSNKTETNNIEQTKKDVIVDLAKNVIVPTYVDMNQKAQLMHDAIQAFNTNTTDSNLLVCQNAWYEVRTAWEKSEGFLFGPVATENIDPRIDTWPVNYQSLDSVLSSNASYSSAYIESLEDALRGFHPIEYLLFGLNKSKKASDFNQRQKEYLLALSDNLKSLSNNAVTNWNNGFYNDFTTPSANSVYKTQREVYEEMVNAISGICDEVANGKITEPFLALNPSLEESPFALNSIVDFTNNMKSVENMYYGKYTVQGKGLTDFVRLYNLSLDNKIKQQITAAITSLNNITVPFGRAITEQPNQIQNSISAINELKAILEEDLMNLVKTHTN